MSTKQLSVEKALRGLPVHELEELINLCCTQGQRSKAYTDDRGNYGLYTHWDYEAIGIAVRFEYYKSVSPSFRLTGKDWGLTFLGYLGTLESHYLKNHEYIEMRVGPLHERGHYDFRRGVQHAPEPLKISAYKFRRRGNLQAFKSDLSLLRLTL